MPAKTFTCEICGSEVSRPKSYLFKKGRACRSHSEVVQWREEHNRKAKKQEERKREDEKRRRERKEAAMAPPSLRPTCHACKRKDALSIGQALLEQAVDRHQFPGLFVKMLRDSVVGNAEEARENLLHRKALQISERTLLPCQMPDKLPFRVPMFIFDMYKCGLPLLLCGSCREKHKIEYSDEFKKQINNPPPLPDLEVLNIWGAAIGPILDEAVTKRLEKN